MNRIRAHILIFCLALSAWIIGANQSVFAQDTDKTILGVTIPQGTAEQLILNQLQDYKRLGIRVIEVHDPVSISLIDSLYVNGFQVFIRSSLKFLTVSELQDENTLIENYQPFLQRYSNNPKVQALGVFNYSQRNPAFQINSLVDSFSDSLSTNLYQHHTWPNSSVTNILLANSEADQSGAYFYFDERFHPSELAYFSSLIQQDATLILVNSRWLSNAISESNLFEDALIAYADGDDFLFPTEQTKDYPQPSQWPVVFLLLIWLSLGIHILFVPTYRPLIFRYFTYHRFFVDDVMRYRERSSISGIFLLFQHAFLSGLMVYVFCMQTISEIGLQAFYYHLPYAAVFGQNYFSIFALTVLTSVIIQFVSLIWIYLPSKSMNHFSQAINLYTWVFHLDFLIVSFGLIKLITGTSTALITVLLTLHLVISILAFFLAAYDSSKYMLRGRLKYMVSTFGIYLLLNIILITLFLYSGYPYQILELAVSL
ncbi:MAG: hypothetical protein JJ895_16330 [Balneolaceae bacterium]|nr:hypothetical protein [Balneolaceae bacterium]